MQPIDIHVHLIHVLHEVKNVPAEGLTQNSSLESPNSFCRVDPGRLLLSVLSSFLVHTLCECDWVCVLVYFHTVM